MNLNVHPVHFTVDEKLVSLIKEKSKKLETFNDSIVNVDVFLKLENGSHIKDKTVEIKVSIPHNQVFVKHTSKTFEESFSLALDSTINKLKKKKEIIKG